MHTYLKQHHQNNHALPQSFPFVFGWIGYFGYHYAWLLEKLPLPAKKDSTFPEAWFGYYEVSVICDHRKKASYCFYQNKHDPFFKKIDAALNNPLDNCPKQFIINTPFTSNLNTETYTKKFNRIKQHIYEGDIYQINFSQRFKSHYTGDPFAAYCNLRRDNPAPFSALLRLDSPHWIASCSPERFLKIEDRIASTYPIKGTQPRHKDPVKDQHYKTVLQNSTKDHAENIMIVDLLRNDLSRHCQADSIQVPELCQLYSFQNVHHLIVQ